MVRCAVSHNEKESTAARYTITNLGQEGAAVCNCKQQTLQRSGSFQFSDLHLQDRDVDNSENLKSPSIAQRHIFGEIFMRTCLVFF